MRRPSELYLTQADAVAATFNDAQTELFAPAHWALEIIGVLVRVDPAVVDDAILALLDMQPNIVVAPQLRRAAELSKVLDHHLFDTLYHAVAIEMDATLITADERYFGKAQQIGGISRLADFGA